MNDEPALIISSSGAVVAAVLVLLISYGAPISPGQQGAFEALAALVIPIVAGVILRHFVSPAAKVVAATPPVVQPPTA